jgi:leader peptidase (prepilin peptidase)/N-methyltransferase
MSIYLSTTTLIYSIIVTFIFGACMGSFLNCTAQRIVKGESFIHGRSHCPNCKHELKAIDLIPIVSWIIQKGKCRYCNAKISSRYPITEITFAILSVLCILKFDLSILGLRNYILISILFIISLTDIDEMIIPDKCLILAILIWFITAPFIYNNWTDIIPNLIAMILFGGGVLCCSLLMDKLLNKDTMGGGDIKLIATTSLYLGPIGSLLSLFISCILGILFNLKTKKEFPFGPWIAISCCIVLFFGDPLINWYQNLLR